MSTFLESSDTQSHGCLGVSYLVGLIKNDSVPVDMEQSGSGGHSTLFLPCSHLIFLREREREREKVRGDSEGRGMS